VHYRNIIYKKFNIVYWVKNIIVKLCTSEEFGFCLLDPLYKFMIDNGKDLEHDGFQNFTNIILGIHRNHHSLGCTVKCLHLLTTSCYCFHKQSYEQKTFFLILLLYSLFELNTYISIEIAVIPTT